MNLLSIVLSPRKKLETPPLPLPLRGGEWLPPEKNSCANCYIIAKNYSLIVENRILSYYKTVFY